VVKHVVLVIITKSTLTYTNCGKIGRSMETWKEKYQLCQSI
jgi:hypothetical protein